MRRRWPVAVAAVLAVVAAGIFARVDVEGRPGQPEEPAPPSPGTPDPEPTPSPTTDPAAIWPSVGTWREIANSPSGPRRTHTTVWTGPCPDDPQPRSCGELIVWGGRMVTGPRADGMAYHAATDSWRPIPPAPRAPLEWGAVPAVWTGTELVVWGATEADFAGEDAGAGPRGVAFDPVADQWRTLPEAPLDPRFGHTITWTGSEAVVWGGRRAGGSAHGELLTDGAAYDPGADAWRPLAAAPLDARRDHTAVWLPEAGRLIVWGGAQRDGRWTPVLDGASYDPAADLWESIPPPPVAAPTGAAALEPAAALLASPERLAAAGALSQPDTGEPVLALYDPEERRWRLVETGPLGVWGGARLAGDEPLMAWGGSPGAPLGGAAYWAGSDSWRSAPEGRRPVPGESVTRTDAGLLTWGGGQEGAIWQHVVVSPGTDRSRGRPQEPGETRTADLPAGHETGWAVEVPQDRPPPTVEVRGGGDAVEVWLEARSQRSWRMLRRRPVTSECTPERCLHRFDPLPERLPGPVEVRVANPGDQPRSFAVGWRD